MVAESVPLERLPFNVSWLQNQTPLNTCRSKYRDCRIRMTLERLTFKVSWLQKQTHLNACRSKYHGCRNRPTWTLAVQSTMVAESDPLERLPFKVPWLQNENDAWTLNVQSTMVAESDPLERWPFRGPWLQNQRAGILTTNCNAFLLVSTRKMKGSIKALNCPDMETIFRLTWHVVTTTPARCFYFQFHRALWCCCWCSIFLL
jgi:hypothetical protein